MISPTTDPMVITSTIASIDAVEVQLQAEISALKLQLTELERKYRDERTRADQMTSDRTVLWERLANARITVQDLNSMVSNLLNL